MNAGTLYARLATVLADSGVSRLPIRRALAAYRARYGRLPRGYRAQLAGLYPAWDGAAPIRLCGASLLTAGTAESLTLTTADGRTWIVGSITTP